MGFEVHQVRKLRAKLKPRHIRSRLVEGTELHYLEGWHVIAEANRIFGFDGWDRETVESKCVWTKQNGSRFSAAYVTRVRITVKAGDTSIVREGSGAGEAHEATPGLAHDRAAKAAETDATKRALMTFGNAFGLSLYAGPPDPAVASWL
jgi:DNA recombination protein Rad52